jgi:hypothetical protein
MAQLQPEEALQRSLPAKNTPTNSRIFKYDTALTNLQLAQDEQQWQATTAAEALS